MRIKTAIGTTPSFLTKGYGNMTEEVNYFFFNLFDKDGNVKREVKLTFTKSVLIARRNGELVVTDSLEWEEGESLTVFPLKYCIETFAGFMENKPIYIPGLKEPVCFNINECRLFVKAWIRFNFKHLEILDYELIDWLSNEEDKENYSNFKHLAPIK